MLNRAHSLAAILERMLALYQRVNEVLVRERRALVEFDFEMFFELFKEKDEVLSAIRALDKDRLRIQDHFGLVMDRPSHEISLRVVGEALSAQGGDAEILGRRLLTLRDHLAAVMDATRHCVLNNKTFTERSIKNLQEVASHITSLATGRGPRKKSSSSVYTKKAKSQVELGNSGTLVEKRY